jgi:hypothetical protein
VKTRGELFLAQWPDDAILERLSERARGIHPHGSV